MKLIISDRNDSIQGTQQITQTEENLQYMEISRYTVDNEKKKLQRHSPTCFTREVCAHLLGHKLPAGKLGVGELNNGKEELALLCNIPVDRHLRLLCLRYVT